MDQKELVWYSKFLSLVLRHRPEFIGLSLDANGWVEIDTLLAQSRAHGRHLTRPMLDEVVATNSKQRFAVSDDGLRIRASQGHTVNVDLGYEPQAPPALLFHGTTPQRLGAIRAHGLQRMRRHHVHLSPDEATAQVVGGRRGDAVILRVRAEEMHSDGYVFYRSANGVWLTESVPAVYLEFPDGKQQKGHS